MEHWDVIIVGAGPAGSSCAWALRNSGLRVLMLDQARFPRNKVCGGWITPIVVSLLQLDLEMYGSGRVLQPISGFRIGYAERPAIELSYGSVVSYAILRREFDEFLLRRSRVAVREGYRVEQLERTNSRWIINNEMSASLVVGAGGHFCPIARQFRANSRNDLIVAQEAEFAMSPEQQSQCSVRQDVPELYFCQDLKGYGWCVRKGDYLNIGLGRIDKHQLRTHVEKFLKFITGSGRIGFDVSERFNGHTYFAYASQQQNALPDGILLIGDALGTAIAASGEGIGPAILSGVAAARTIVEVDGDYRSTSLERATQSVHGWLSAGWSAADLLPSWARQRVAATLLQQEWFCRGVVIDKWFLQRRKRLPGWAVPTSHAAVA